MSSAQPSGRRSILGSLLPDVSPYVATRLLGQGGMGVVVAARAPDGREVAIKVVRQASATALARFEQERRLLASFTLEDGFVPLLDQGTAPAGPFFVMPLVAGGTLRARLERGPSSVDETLSVGRALATAVGRAHAKGIVHRDLKPENVLFTAEGVPLVTDLGLARYFRDDAPGAHSLGLSKTGEMRGTVSYMAPEQALDAKRVGPPADVFSLGAILHECLAGRAPFEGDSVVDVMTKLERGAPPLCQLAPDAPAWLGDVIDRALAKHPSARFLHGQALADALAAGETRAPGSRRFALLGGVAAAVALLALVAAVARARRSDPSAAELVPVPAAAVAMVPSAAAPPPSAPAERFPRQVADLVAPKEKVKLEAVYGTYRWRLAYLPTVIAVSPDGRRAISGGSLWQAVLWDLETGEDLGLLEGHRAPTTAIAFSPNGKRVLTGAHDGSVTLFRTLERLGDKETLAAPTHRRVLAVHLGADGTALAVRDDGEIVAWPRGAAATRRRAPGPDLTAAAISPDGTSALLFGHDGAVHLALTESGDTSQLERVPAAAGWGAFSRDGARLLLCGAEGGSAVSWVADALSGEMFELPGRGGPRGAALSPDGGLVAAGDAEGVRVFDVDSRRQLHHLPELHCTALTFSPDGKRLVSSSEHRAVRYWDVETGRELSRPDDGGFGQSVWLSPDGARAVCGFESGIVRVWDLRTGAGRELARLPSGAGQVRWSRDGRSIVVAALDGSVRALDAATGAELALFAMGGARAVALSDDSRTTLVSVKDVGLVVWDVATGATRTLEGTPAGDQVAISADGRAGLVSTDGILRTVDLRSGALGPEQTLGDARRATALLHAPDLTRVFVGNEGGRAHVVDPSSPSGRRIDAHRNAITSIAWDPARQLLATGAYDQQVIVWDSTGAAVTKFSLARSGDAAKAMAFTPDGALLVLTHRGVLLKFAIRP